MHRPRCSQACPQARHTDLSLKMTTVLVWSVHRSRGLTPPPGRSQPVRLSISPTCWSTSSESGGRQTGMTLVENDAGLDSLTRMIQRLAR